MIGSIAAVVSAWVLGTLLVAALWPTSRRLRDDMALVASLGWGFGLGLTSATWFFLSRLGSSAVAAELVLELVVTGGLLIAVRKRHFQRHETDGTPSTEGIARWIYTSLLAQAALVASIVVFRVHAAAPHGAWDAWAIWNMRARFIFRGGTSWTELLEFPQVAWSHLDYPLLVSASIARGWSLVGTENTTIPALVSVGFGIACVFLLVALVARLRGALAACLSGLMLLSTPFFITFSAQQHADIPLACFILTTVGLLTLAPNARDGWQLHALAGFAAGLAAWTKNEGLLFVAVLLLAVTILRRGRVISPQAVAFAGGLALAAIPVAMFKVFHAPANDIVSATLAERWALLLDYSRHATILATLGRDLLGFGEWRLAPYWPMAVLSLAFGVRRHADGGSLVVIVTLGMLLGYCAVYLVTPWELQAHLDTSLVRLILHLWPTALLGWCLYTAWGPGAIATPIFIVTRSKRQIGGTLIALNLALALATLTALGGQLAPHELAARARWGADVRVTLGDGWFQRESHGSDTWVWSRGESVLHVEVARPPAEAALTFSMRAIVPQTVTVSLGDEVLWRGVVPEYFIHVRLPAVPLATTPGSISFRSDTLGRRESAESNARELTFAVYNVKLR